MGVWISRGNFISLLYKACAVSLYTILVRKIGGHFVTLFFNMSQNDLKLPNRILLIFSAIHIKSFAFRFATPSILLLCSFNSTNKGGIIRECPPEVISSISMLSDDTNSYRQLSTEKRYDAPNVKLSEVNLLCFTLRTPMFTKTSKPLSTIKVLCHYRILLPEQKFNSLYPSINYVKSSCKYFIYTLGHILI